MICVHPHVLIRKILFTEGDPSQIMDLPPPPRVSEIRTRLSDHDHAIVRKVCDDIIRAVNHQHKERYCIPLGDPFTEAMIQRVREWLGPEWNVVTASNFRDGTELILTIR